MQFRCVRYNSCHIRLSAWGTWCSGITSASHAEGPGFKSQCVHFLCIACLYIVDLQYCDIVYRHRPLQCIRTLYVRCHMHNSNLRLNRTSTPRISPIMAAEARRHADAARQTSPNMYTDACQNTDLQFSHVCEVAWDRDMAF